MRKKMIKWTALAAAVFVCGILYSCQNRPGGGETEVILQTDSTGGILIESEVDIKSEDNKKGSEDVPADDRQSLTETVCVYVCGAVKHAGVYTLHCSDRIEAAIEAAGGFSEDADTSAINLAQMMEDGQKIDVPSVNDASVHDSGDETLGLLDINKASAAELMTLPGIGEAKAAQIIAYREAHGFFASVDALKQVPGIKDGVFENIKTLICAG